MNYKKILSIFLVVASLLATVGVNSGLTCFAGRYYTESEQREHDIREMKRKRVLLYGVILNLCLNLILQR